MRTFAQAAVFDWSGRAIERPHGIALARARAGAAPQLIAPQHRWSRVEALDWIIARHGEGADLVIGLDLGFALPFADAGAYFPGHPDTPRDARALWAMVERVAASDPHLGAGTFVDAPDIAPYFRHAGRRGDRYGAAAAGRLRITERESRRQDLANPVSNLNLVGAAQVGKASLTGMRLLHRLNGIVPIWPFDPVPASGVVLVEIYTSIAARAAGRPRGRSKMRSIAELADALAALDTPAPDWPTRVDDHATDAMLTAAWLAQASRDTALWHPARATPATLACEGWTFGVA